MNSTHSPILGVHRKSEPVSQRDIPQKLTLSPGKTSTHGSSGAYLCARENSAGDSDKSTNTNFQRVEELEKLISRLNNAMLTLEEENLKLHKRLIGKPEMSAQATPDYHSSNSSFTNNGGFSAEKTDKDSSHTSLLQEDKYTQLKIENNSMKKKLKEAEKSCKQCGRDFQKLLQMYEDLKAQSQILEQDNKQLVNDKKALEEKLDGHVGKEPKDVSETVARLKEENRLLKEELGQTTERSAQVEESARRLREEQAILEDCLQTVQKENDLLQMEVRALHQDYISLSDSISLQLRDRVPGEDRAPKPRRSGSPTPNHAPVFTQRNSNSTELKENTLGAGMAIGSVLEKAPAIRRSSSSDNITLQLKDRVSGARRSTGSTPDKAPADCKRISKEENKPFTKGNPTQTVKNGHIGGICLQI